MKPWARYLFPEVITIEDASILVVNTRRACERAAQLGLPQARLLREAVELEAVLRRRWVIRLCRALSRRAAR